MQGRGLGRRAILIFRLVSGLLITSSKSSFDDCIPPSMQMASFWPKYWRLRRHYRIYIYIYLIYCSNIINIVLILIILKLNYDLQAILYPSTHFSFLLLWVCVIVCGIRETMPTLKLAQRTNRENCLMQDWDPYNFHALKTKFCQEGWTIKAELTR